MFKRKLIIFAFVLISIIIVGCHSGILINKSDDNSTHTSQNSQSTEADSSTNQTNQNEKQGRQENMHNKVNKKENDKDSGTNERVEDTSDSVEKDNAEAIPTSKKEIIPDDSKQVEKLSNNILKGRVLCIDPGHQATANYDLEPIAPSSERKKAKTSTGTKGVATGIPEYQLNLEVSKKLRDALKQYGVEVIMTREENDVDISNVERAIYANERNADLVLRIHADASGNSSVSGISVLVPGSKHISDKKIISLSRAAGQNILECMIEATGARSIGVVPRDDLTGFNWSEVPVVLIEMGFMSNVSEDKTLNSPEYQDKIVEGIVDGILKYFSENKHELG